jgi:hypothetical protein
MSYVFHGKTWCMNYIGNIVSKKVRCTFCVAQQPFWYACPSFSANVGRFIQLVKQSIFSFFISSLASNLPTKNDY